MHAKIVGRIESTIPKDACLANCCTKSSREARLAEVPERQRQEIMRYGAMDFRKIWETRGGMAHYGPHVAPPVDDSHWCKYEYVIHKGDNLEEKDPLSPFLFLNYVLKQLFTQ